MRDFDAEAPPPTPEDERSFKIGGKRFVGRAVVGIDDWTAWWDVWAKRTEITNAEFVAATDLMIENALEPGYVEQWRDLRANPDPDRPITSGEPVSVLLFLWEVQTGRPTERAASSTGGPETNGTPSTEKQHEPVPASPA